MNVKVCTFPDGEDPDSFARKKTEQELRQYLENNAKDFIAYKASLLMKDAKNDPVKKAGLIRDMVTSISKIPDRIQTEIYIQECSRIMDISEEVLFSSLAQIKKKSFEEANKGFKKNQKVFDVVQRNEPVKKVNIQYELERKIIEILLLYGNKTEEFEDLVLKEADSGELILEPTIHKAKVFEKIYLDLQEDEMEFTNENFKVLYYTLVDTLNQNPDYALESFINLVDDKSASEITNILMNDERYSLHDWERKNIFPKDKSHSISQLVNETILSLRCFLIDQKVTEFRQATQDTKSSNKTILEDVLNYSNLKMLLSRKLNRVL